MSLAISLALTGSGWITATIADEVNNATITGSYLSDAPRDLIECVALLAEGVESVSCSWHEEPGEFRWLFSRTQSDGVEITIRFFADFYQHEPDDAGSIVFATLAPLRRLVTVVLRGADDFGDAMTAEEYRSRWVAFDFPSKSIERLRSALTALPIQLITWQEHVRRRPEMYFGKTPRVEDVIACVIADAAYELYASKASCVLVEILPDGAIQVADDGGGIPNVAIRGRPRLATLLSDAVPAPDERGALSAVAALCKDFSITTVAVTGMQKAILVDGVIESLTSSTTPTAPTGTTVRFKPSANTATGSPSINREECQHLALQQCRARSWWKPSFESLIVVTETS